MTSTVTHPRTGQKLVVMSNDYYRTIMDKERYTQSPEYANLKRLDDKIAAILKDKRLPTSKKAILYRRAAADFVDVYERAPETYKRGVDYLESAAHRPASSPSPQPPAAPISPQLPAAPTSPEPREEEELVEQMETPETSKRLFARAEEWTPVFHSPETEAMETKELAEIISNPERRTRALNILNQIRDPYGKVTYDPRTGALITFGNVYPDANVYDIVNYVTKKNPSTKERYIPPGLGYFLHMLGIDRVDVGDSILNKKLLGMTQVTEMQRTPRRPFATPRAFSTPGAYGTGGGRKRHPAKLAVERAGKKIVKWEKL